METALFVLVIVFPSYGSEPQPPTVIGRFQSEHACEVAGDRVLASMTELRTKQKVSSKFYAERLCLAEKVVAPN
jgi:hypothetical protein